MTDGDVMWTGYGYTLYNYGDSQSLYILKITYTGETVATRSPVEVIQFHQVAHLHPSLANGGCPADFNPLAFVQQPYGCAVFP